MFLRALEWRLRGTAITGYSLNKYGHVVYIMTQKKAIEITGLFWKRFLKKNSTQGAERQRRKEKYKEGSA